MLALPPDTGMYSVRTCADPVAGRIASRMGATVIRADRFRQLKIKRNPLPLSFFLPTINMAATNRLGFAVRYCGQRGSKIECIQSALGSTFFDCEVLWCDIEFRAPAEFAPVRHKFATAYLDAAVPVQSPPLSYLTIDLCKPLLRP